MPRGEATEIEMLLARGRRSTEREHALEERTRNLGLADNAVRERIQALIKEVEKEQAIEIPAGRENEDAGWDLVEHIRDTLAQLNRDHWEPEPDDND